MHVYVYRRITSSSDNANLLSSLSPRSHMLCPYVLSALYPLPTYLFRTRIH